MLRRDLALSTSGRGLVELTPQLARVVAEAGVEVGVACVFVHHTSASLLVGENADPDVRADLETFLSGLVPDGDPRHRHVAEGPDDMPAHIRSALTATSVTLPITDGRLDLNPWQGLFLWEHRTAPHRRRVSVTILP